jgi:uncharacterized protein (DUF488 family)
LSGGAIAGEFLAMNETAHPAVIWTIGHSNREWGDFVRILTEHGIELVVDVRKLPGSRKFPHFNADAMGAGLAEKGIRYLHAPELGGRRRPAADSPNSGWENASFQAFADYMLTEDFAAALERLLARIDRQRASLMCAEAVPWRCHRNLIADALVVRGVRIEHLLGGQSIRPHVLNPMARVSGTRITYPPTTFF